MGVVITKLVDQEDLAAVAAEQMIKVRISENIYQAEQELRVKEIMVVGDINIVAVAVEQVEGVPEKKEMMLKPEAAVTEK
jgi:hypothetical protein